MSFGKGWWPLLRVSRGGALVSGSHSHLWCLWKQVWAWRHHCPVHRCGGWGWGWVGVLDCIALRDRERAWLRLWMCKACCMPVEPLCWQACCRSMEWGQSHLRNSPCSVCVGGVVGGGVGILHGAAPKLVKCCKVPVLACIWFGNQHGWRTAQEVKNSDTYHIHTYHKLKLKLKHFIGQPWKAALPIYKHIINTHIDTKGNEMRWKHAEGTIILTSGTPWGSFLCSCLASAYIDTRVLI